MRTPDARFHFKQGSEVFTSSAMEQLGEDIKPFIQFLLKSRPSICLHLEPIADLYDQNNLIDYLAYKFHKNRHYLDGLLTYLKELETNGKITIMKVLRLYYGNAEHEGYSAVIWKPV